MPTPGEKESKEDYIKRCMAYTDMQKYDPAQRRAICESMWGQKSKSSKEDPKEWR
jgi:hypothetical protein